MDVKRLQNLVMDSSATNSTLSSLPSTLLDATIPGYGIISQLIFRLFGIDIGLVVSGCLIVFGIFQGAQSLYKRSYTYYLDYFTASIEIENDDDLYDSVVSWVADQRMTKVSRALKAVTQYANVHQLSEDEAVDCEESDPDEDVLDERGIFNFEKWASTIPPRYEPNYGSDRFQHKGYTFWFIRLRKDNKRSLWRHGHDESLSIRCVGRSTKPIKDLLKYIKTWTLSKENKMTSVYRPSVREDDHQGGWERQACRLSRPISTVSLDRAQKANVVRDINEYLHPATARWYATHGIPYRRGYLFHGPPGTGKTSLSFSLAGIFGINIYVVSLSETGLTEGHLGKLFSMLPKRCIVLLEDIDSAGLRRDGEQEAESCTDTDTDSDDDISKISKPSPKDSAKPKNSSTTSRITLSGLLNIIDGAASHEGRVLIMSTNYPEKLDSALIRPGRVDLQVEFTLATHDQIADIFIRMYTNTLTRASKSPKTKTKSENTIAPAKDKQLEDILDFLTQETKLSVFDPEKVAAMAKEFAEQLPETIFSPAEIQGYLLIRKTDPEGAVAGAGVWRDRTIEAKKKGKKVVTAQ